MKECCRQAAQVAWTEGWHENYRVNFEGHITAGNPYRETP